MLGFCTIAPLGDAVAKLLGSSLPLTEILFGRFLIQTLILFPLVWICHRQWSAHGFVLGLIFLRTVLHIVGIGAMVTALIYLPLADAVAIVFVMPFFMLILGKLVLKEEVGLRRLLACLVGFIGTVMVVQPSFLNIGWPALLPVFVAANFSVFMLITRKIAKETDPVGLQALSGLMAVGILAPALLFGSFFVDTPLKLVMADEWTWLLLLSIGGLGTLAHLMMTWALKYAPSATLAPMQYLEIPFATLLGLIIFRELPNTTATFGICITVAAGIYVILRERSIAQRQARQSGQPALA